MVKLVKIILVSFLCLLITFCSTATIAEARNISDIELHHIFPQQFRSDFERIGINIDDSTIKIPKQLHQTIHSSGWNNKWQTYFQANPAITKAQVWSKVENMLGELGLTGRQELYKYSQSSVQKTGEIIVKHPVWILRFAGNIGETVVKWCGGTGIGSVVIGFLSSVGTIVLGWFGVKADHPTLVGVGVLAILIGLLLSVSILYLTFLIYTWLFAVVIPIIAAAFSLPLFSEA